MYCQATDIVKTNRLTKQNTYYQNDSQNQSIDCHFDSILFCHVVMLFECSFLGKLWTTIENSEFVAKVVLESELKHLCEEEQQTLLNDLLGFTRVYRLLKSSKKPIIGHNLLTDLMIMVNSFEGPLPKNYKRFKQHLHSLFPTIFDTKTISFEVQKSITYDKRWSQNYLEGLYKYFRDGNGRHLTLKSPYIEMQGLEENDIGKFHNAGWDSYCTGYIFIRMAHYLAVSQFHGSLNKIYMSSELLQAVAKHKNCLNLIRGNLSYIVSFLLIKIWGVLVFLVLDNRWG